VIAEPQPCNYCGATILWLRTRTGAFMPVDEAPSPTGNVLRQGGNAGVLGPNQAAAARANGVELRAHHALSCPQAPKWQGPKGGRR